MKLLVIEVFIAFGFVAWSIVGSYSKASSAWIGVLVLMTTCAMVALLSGRELINFSSLGVKSILYLLVAGAINGTAFYLYTIKVADKNIQLSVFIATVSIMMLMIAPILDLIINDRTMSLRQIAGLFVASGAIYLLKS